MLNRAVPHLALFTSIGMYLQMVKPFTQAGSTSYLFYDSSGVSTISKVHQNNITQPAQAQKHEDDNSVKTVAIGARDQKHTRKQCQ